MLNEIKRTSRDLNSYSTIKEIKNIPLQLSDAGEILRSLEGEPDRVTAIVGAELISTIAANIICKKMNVDIGCLPFSSSARLALISDSLTKDTQAETNIIFQIRNAFAHYPVNLKFDTPAVARECKKITAIEKEDFIRLFPNFPGEEIEVSYWHKGEEISPDLAIADSQGGVGIDFIFPKGNTPKSRFIKSVGIISFGLLLTELAI